jgi:hypothetical protein
MFTAKIAKDAKNGFVVLTDTESVLRVLRALRGEKERTTGFDVPR